jgi:hypothetical protein
MTGTGGDVDSGLAMPGDGVGKGNSGGVLAANGVRMSVASLP